MADREKPQGQDPKVKPERPEIYSHEGLDFPDSSHDPFPTRHYPAEFQAREEQELERQKALIAEYRKRSQGRATKIT